MIVRGHSVFAAMLSERCSLASPTASRAIPNFEMHVGRPCPAPGAGQAADTCSECAPSAASPCAGARNTSRYRPPAHLPPSSGRSASGAFPLSGGSPDGAGVIDQDIEAAELRHGALHQVRGWRLLRARPWARQGPAARVRIASAVSCTLPGRRSVECSVLAATTTLAPSRARRRASALPMPRLAPVTTATRPLRSG